MAFAAVAAVIAGEAVTAATVMAAVSTVGTVMTVVGAVTGAKDLMKIGGVMALVGGVGGMVAGAASGAAAAAEGAAMGAEGAVANTVASAGDYVNAMDAMSDSATTGLTGGTDAIVSPVSMTQPQVTPLGPVAANATPEVAMAPAQSPIIGPTQAAPEVMGAQAPTGAVAPTGPSTPYDNIDVGGGWNPAGTAPQDSSSFFTRFSDWANKNKTMFGAGMQLAGGLVNGMNQRQMWDQKMNLGQQRLAQTSHGSEVGNWAPIVAGAR